MYRFKVARLVVIMGLALGTFAQANGVEKTSNIQKNDSPPPPGKGDRPEVRNGNVLNDNQTDKNREFYGSKKLYKQNTDSTQDNQGTIARGKHKRSRRHH